MKKNHKADVDLITFGIRLHFGLISMSKELPRSYGGIGISIPNLGGYCIQREDGPSVLINGSVSELYSSFLNKLSDNLSMPRISIDVRLNFPQHCGFGTGTQIRLAIIELYNKLFALRIRSHEKIVMSSRGGASGIGIIARQYTGFIFDLGRPAKKNNSFLPTSSLSGCDDHLYLPVLNFPWTTIIAVPKNYDGFCGEDEVTAFQQICPVAQASSYAAGYEALFGVYSAVLEGSFDTFCESLDRFQNFEWKAAVLNRAPKWLHSSKEQLVKHFRTPFFISSWGPAMSGFLKEKIDEAAFQKRKSEFEKHNGNYKLRMLGPILHKVSSEMT